MNDIIVSNPQIMHGEPCFAGTRVTMQTLFDHLEEGYSIDGFLAEFPTVQRTQIVGLLAELKKRTRELVVAGA